MVKSIWAFFLIFSLGACSAFGEGADKAEKLVELHHKLYNSAKYDRIYKTSDKIYQDGSTKEHNRRLFKTIQKKLGRFRSKKRTNLSVNATPQGTFITLIYTSEFALDQGVETFQIKWEDEKAGLTTYHISSDALMVELEE